MTKIYTVLIVLITMGSNSGSESVDDLMWASCGQILFLKSFFFFRPIHSILTTYGKCKVDKSKLRFSILSGKNKGIAMRPWRKVQAYPVLPSSIEYVVLPDSKVDEIFFKMHHARH